MADLMQMIVDVKDQATVPLKEIQGLTQEVRKEFALLNPTVLGVSIGIGGLTTAMEESITAFATHELAVKKLNDALQNAGVLSKDYSEHLQGIADSLQQTTKYSENQVLSVQQLLITFGLFGKTLDQATKASLDMSSALGIDAESAARALGKAFEGNAAGLRRYGIEVDLALPKNKQFADAMEQIVAKMGGRAEGEAGTLSGSFTMARNAAEKFFATIGGVLSSVLHLPDVFNAAAKAANDLAISLGGGTEKERLTQQYNELVTLLGRLQSMGSTTFEKGFSPAEIESKLDAIRNRMVEIDRIEKGSVDTAQKRGDLLHQQRLDLEAMSKVIQDSTEFEIKRAGERFNIVNDEMLLFKQDHALQSERTLEFEEQLKYLKSQREELEKMKEAAPVTAIQGALAGNAAQIVQAGATAFVSGAQEATMIGLLADIAIHAGELPDKIKAMIDGLAKGISDGIPKLISYLGTEFIPQLTTGLAQAIGGLLQNLVGSGGALFGFAKSALTSSLDMISGGAFSGISHLLGFGGDDRSPQEKFRDTMTALSKTFQDLNSALRSTVNDMIMGLSSPDQQEGILRKQMGNLEIYHNLIAGEFISASKAGATDKAAEYAKQLADNQQQQIDTAKKLYDIETARLDNSLATAKQIYDTQLQQQQQIKQFAQDALNSFVQARESILGAQLGPTNNLERLRTAYQTASSPQAKAAAAAALAQGFQSSISAAQNLASQGAISGEEFAKIQQSTVSELDKLIASQQQQVDQADTQIKILQSGFAAFQASIDAQRAELKSYFTQLILGLQDVNVNLKSSNQGSSVRAYMENTRNLRGVIQTVLAVSTGR